MIELFVLSKHRFKPFFVGILNVQELTSERSEKVPVEGVCACRQ